MTDYGGDASREMWRNRKEEEKRRLEEVIDLGVKIRALEEELAAEHSAFLTTQTEKKALVADLRQQLERRVNQGRC